MKKRIKKLLAVMLAGVMTVSIMTGCGSSSASGDSASGSASSDELNIIIWDGTWSEDMFKKKFRLHTWLTKI